MPVPMQPPHPALLQPMALPQALAVESVGRLRGPTYRRPTRGIYRAAGSDDHGERMRAFRLAVPGGVFGGPSAAWALGVRMASPGDPVEMVLPAARRVRVRDGLAVRGDRLVAAEVVQTPFGPATSPARTAFDLARRGRPERALAWADALLRETRATGAELRRVLGWHRGARGVRQARVVLNLADPRAESPRESMLRWTLLEAGLPAPTPQVVVLDPTGRFVARLDLAWPQLRVGTEYDGDQHREREQHARDLVRHNDLRALGWVVVQVDAAQLRDPDPLIRTLRGLLSRRV